MNTKLTSKITNGIGWFTAWFLIFPTMVVYGIFTILINKVYGKQRQRKYAWDFGRIKDSPEKHEESS